MILNTLPEKADTYALVHRWLGFLLQHMDHEQLARLLEYYQNIGWISAEVRDKLNAIASGINSAGKKGTWQLPGRVHLTSLLFIVYLAEGTVPSELYTVDSYARIFTSNPESMISI